MIQRLWAVVGLAATSIAAPALGQADSGLAETYNQLCRTPAAAATDSCVELRRAMGGGDARPAADTRGPSRERPMLISAGDLFEVPPGPLSRSFKTPYGQTTSFELKVPKGRTVEVEVEASQGVAKLQVCWIPDEFLGGSGPCYAPNAVNKGRALYRLFADRKGEVKVKASKTKGPAGATYQVTTREEPRGHGAALLARLERLAGRPHVMKASAEGIPVDVAVDFVAGVPGRSGRMRFRGEDNTDAETKLTLDEASGDLMFESPSGAGIVLPGPDGEVSFFVRGGRAGWAINADGTVRRSVDQKLSNFDRAKTASLGGFQRLESLRLKPTSEAEIAEMRRAGPKRIELAKGQRLLDWGAYAHMAGRSWLFANDHGGQNIAQYEWETPGHVLIGKFWTVGWYGVARPFTTLRIEHDAESGQIRGAFTSDQGHTTPVTVKRGPLGEALATEGEWRVRLELASPNDVLVQSARGNAPMGAPKRYAALDKVALASLADRGRAAEAQRRAQAAAQESSGGGSGLFGAFLGASMGALAGGNSEQIMGAAIKGVQMVDPGNQVGQALGGQADALISGQGFSAGNTLTSNLGLGGVAGVGGGGGSYPTKPNLAAGLCPGFSEANYRTVALQPGGDVQRKSFCGQAYEYYTMYKRAIAQGYSEADSNRTYAAHEGTVAQLRNFVGQ